MTPPRPPAEPAADQRVVVDYDDIQIVDARQMIRIIPKRHLPQRICNQLIKSGWIAANDGAWEQHASPMTIFNAQDIVNQYRGLQK